MSKKYGYYTKEIITMINKNLLDAITEKLEDYSHVNLSETTRDQLIAVLDYMVGRAHMAQEIIVELETEDDKDDEST